MKSRNWILWIAAILITLASSYYQRLTGPTKPYRGEVVLADTNIGFSLIRSYARPSDAPVRITVADQDVKGYFRFKRYPSHDEWQEMQLEREEDMLIAYIPQQPAAGKVMYQLFLQKDDAMVQLTEDPIVIRFRNDVPAWAMIPHILFMFLAMLFSMRTGLQAVFSGKTFRLTLITTLFLVAGGLIFGPIVQKFAFGDYWTGWPYGTDLTDNKTAVAVVFWFIALVVTWRNDANRLWPLIAAIILFVIYMIPHSLLGSEIDWTEENGHQLHEAAACLSQSAQQIRYAIF